MRFKACAKCGGDLCLEAADRAWFCIQCGGRFYVDPPSPLMDGGSWAEYEKKPAKERIKRYDQEARALAMNKANGIE